jgi:hypothetical protein
MVGMKKTVFIILLVVGLMNGLTPAGTNKNRLYQYRRIDYAHA